MGHKLHEIHKNLELWIYYSRLEVFSLLIYFPKYKIINPIYNFSAIIFRKPDFPISYNRLQSIITPKVILFWLNCEIKIKVQRQKLSIRLILVCSRHEQSY